MANNKIILITGANSGFGQAISSKLIEDGYIVYGTFRNNANQLNAGGKYIQLDIRDRESIRAGIDSIIKEHGRIDVLINNAGVGVAGATELSSIEDLNFQIGTNLYGCVNMCAEVGKYMRESRAGLIINISSIAGIFAIPYQGLYSASKAAIDSYSQALRMEMKQFNVDISVVCPGDFHTNFSTSRKISDSTLKNDDYSRSFLSVQKCFENDELNGDKPEYLAEKISKIVSSKKHRMRYVVTSNFLQKLSIFLYHILPNNIFQYMLSKFYKMPY